MIPPAQHNLTALPSVTPASQSAPQGGSAVYAVATAVTSGNPQSVTFSASNLPLGVTAQFNPPTVTAGGSSQLTLSVSISTPTGRTTFTVSGTGLSATRSSNADLIVNPLSGGGPIVNGDFETDDLSGWVVTTGMVSAVPTSPPHGGLWAAQIGSTRPFSGDSTLMQTIAVPTAGTNTLSFWYNPHCNDTLTYDWQDAEIRDLSGALLQRIFHLCENTGAWTQATADLTPYNGTSVNLVFTDHDDGFGGDPTWYLLDDVTLSTVATNPPPTTSITSPADGATAIGSTSVNAVGAAQGRATLTGLEIYVDGTLLASGTQSPLTMSWDTTSVANGVHALTSKAYDSIGASTTSSPVNVTVNNGSTGRDLIANGGFEGSLSSWTLGGARRPVLSTDHPHSGSSAVRCGTVPGETEHNGDSYTWQQVTIPADVTSATLTFWYWTFTTDRIQYDWQDANIRSTSGAVLLNIFHICENSRVWQMRTVDLTAFRGQTIRVNFNSHGDGYGDHTALWIDDVSLIVQ